MARQARPHPKPAAKSGVSPGSGNRDGAEEIAISALGFLAADSDRLDRFLALTGLDPSGLRQAAARPGFLLAVMDHVCAHEPDLIAFAEHAGLAPDKVDSARRALAGPEFWNNP